MDEVLRIGAKDLGALALPDFCPRCFYITTHMGCRTPFSRFPGVFTHLDLFEKRLIHGWLDEKKGAPPWLKPLGEITGYIQPPKSSKFFMPLGEHVVIAGEADCILKRSGGDLVILDNKTAVYRGLADSLYPQYKAQLNAYAIIAEYLGLGKVGALALMYAEPCSDEMSALSLENRSEDGFRINFICKVLPVAMDPDLVMDLADKAWEIYSEISAPDGAEGCINCAAMDKLIEAASKVRPTAEAFKAIGCL
jgi:hypothetical protein